MLGLMTKTFLISHYTMTQKQILEKMPQTRKMTIQQDAYLIIHTSKKTYTMIAYLSKQQALDANPKRYNKSILQEI